MKVRKEKKEASLVVSNLDKALQALEQQIENQSKAIGLMQEKFRTDEVPMIVNSPLFFRISFKDIIVILKQLVKDDDANQRNLNARLLAQHLYEFLDDTKDFLGPKMKDALKKLPNEELLIADLYKVKEIYTAFKKHCFKRLGDIRHNTAVHKDHNSKILHGKIQNLDEKQIAVDTIFCSILFSIIVHFQDNVYNSIHIRLNEQRSDSEKISAHEKYVTVKSKFTELTLKAQGVDPQSAEYISGLTDDEQIKLKAKVIEVVKYLDEQKKNKEQTKIL